MMQIQEGYIGIEVTAEDATLFRLFMKHYNIFKFMADEGVFDVKRGNVTLNFDKHGELLSIDKHLFSYAKLSTDRDLTLN